MTINTTLFNEICVVVDGRSWRSCRRTKQHRGVFQWASGFRFAFFFLLSFISFFLVIHSGARVLKLDAVNRKCDTMTHVTCREMKEAKMRTNET